MYLYHAISTYHLLNFMVLRKSIHSRGRGILITADFMLDRFPNLMDLEGGVFDKIYVFQNAELVRNNLDIEKNTNEYFERFFERHKVNLDEFDEIVVGCAHHYFGIYLINNNINFTMLEDGNGLISRPEIVESIEIKLNQNKHEICKQMGLYDGNHNNIKKVICNFSSQADGFDKSKAVNFDVIEALSGLEKEALDQILSFFGIEKKISVQKNSTLLLTQHFANLNVMSFDEQKDIYRIFVDYFILEEDLLIIKPHPDDLMYYDLLFPNAKVIREKFPSELIPFVFTERPNRIATITSTAINSLRNYFEDVLEFSFDFQNNFSFMIHKYFVALKIINDIKSFNNYFEIGADKKLLNNLSLVLDRRYPIYTPKNIHEIGFESVVFVDDLNKIEGPSFSIRSLLEEVDDSVLLVFINSMKRYLFYSNEQDKDLMKYIIPVEIYISDISAENEGYSETIYFYTKDESLRRVINKVDVSKKLNHSEKMINKLELTEDKIKIKVLEGILKATEKRLNHYIKLEEELRKELETIKSKRR